MPLLRRDRAGAGCRGYGRTLRRRVAFLIIIPPAPIRAMSGMCWVATARPFGRPATTLNKMAQRPGPADPNTMLSVDDLGCRDLLR
jgi:hypothetical protein